MPLDVAGAPADVLVDAGVLVNTGDVVLAVGSGGVPFVVPAAVGVVAGETFADEPAAAGAALEDAGPAVELDVLASAGSPAGGITGSAVQSRATTCIPVWE